MLNIARLSRDDAQVLVNGARLSALNMEMPMCIAVTDESGNMILFERMDGAKISSISTAIDKAFTGSTARKGTHIYNQLCVPGEPTFGIHNTNNGRFSVIGGGLPIVVGGQVVGGIGISSGSAGQDFDCAQEAVDYFYEKLGLSA